MLTLPGISAQLFNASIIQRTYKQPAASESTSANFLLFSHLQSIMKRLGNHEYISRIVRASLGVVQSCSKARSCNQTSSQYTLARCKHGERRNSSQASHSLLFTDPTQFRAPTRCCIMRDACLLPIISQDRVSGLHAGGAILSLQMHTLSLSHSVMDGHWFNWPPVSPGPKFLTSKCEVTLKLGLDTCCAAERNPNVWPKT